MWWLICLALAVQAAAVQPALWQQRAYGEFAAGKANEVELRADGALQLSPALEEVARLEAERIWSLLSAPDGTLYAGTGDSGRIFKIDPKGKAELLFDSPEVAIHSLALAKDGTLYAGTAPDGLIYRIDPKGQVTTLAHTGSFYVWDLEFDTQGRLCAATGERARVLAISARGQVDTLCSLPDQHAMTLFLSDGQLYAGTARIGRIYEIPTSGPARLLCETGYDEVRGLAGFQNGTLYACALSQAAGEQKKRAALFCLEKRGAAYPLWQTEEPLLLELQAGPDSSLVAVATAPARLYRFARDGSPSLLAQFENFTPNRLLRAPSGALYLGDSQSGSLRRLESRFSPEGRFESAVEDFGVQAHWGSLSWRAETPAGTRISFQTRSGNSREPDQTWSPWSGDLQESGSPIPSPPAQFLQYRALLASEKEDRTPVLREVALVGLPANIRPEIAALEIYPYQQPGQGGEAQDQAQTQGAPPGRSRRLPQRKSLRLVRWQAQDFNGDKLAYSLFLKGPGQQEWKKVEEDLEQNSLIWDTETMPEGLTLMKLVASDHPDNPGPLAMQAERLSAPFVIDNSPPAISIEVEDSKAVVLTAKFADRISPLQRAQYTVDYSDRAHPIAPADGVFDSQEERARFTVEGLSPGEHIIAVQAWDRLDNVGAEQVVVNIKP